MARTERILRDLYRSRGRDNPMNSETPEGQTDRRSGKRRFLEAPASSSSVSCDTGGQRVGIPLHAMFVSSAILLLGQPTLVAPTSSSTPLINANCAFTSATHPSYSVGFSVPSIRIPVTAKPDNYGVYSVLSMRCVCGVPSSLSLSASKKDQIMTEIEGTEADPEDKILAMDDLIQGSINITAIEDVETWTPRRNGKQEAETKEEIKRPWMRQWKRRHARSIQEGIRTECSKTKLSSLLKGATADSRSDGEEADGKRGRNGRKYAARTITGLIMALAEESSGLEVEVDARRDTPLWGKHVDAIRINFERLGFKPLRMGGLHEALDDVKTSFPTAAKEKLVQMFARSTPSTADEAFDRIDLDNSGALDEEEIATALNMAAKGGAGGRSKEILNNLAARLVSLYDTNDDGVIDREEYQCMVEDMAALQRAQMLREQEKERRQRERLERRMSGKGWRRALGRTLRKGLRVYTNDAAEKQDGHDLLMNATRVDKELLDSVGRGEGSIVLSDLKVDLRRLLFGAVPVVKKITPGGPLVLEPFTMTVNATFNQDDLINSGLLDEGLRRLVARALSRRVRGFRDLVDGAVFYGRTWNMASAAAPIVDVPKLTNIEFDSRDRLIISGRVRVRATPDAAFIENAFKLRTKLGTRENGQVIRLKDPELALVVECPKAWERNIVSACKNIFNYTPRAPKPLYAYFPLVSPFKQTDKDGFNLGEDNCIKSIDTKDSQLILEMSAVLRPGRFLGNHYLAFTVPNRTFIITLDRVREGIRVARRNKLAADAAAKKAEEETRQRATESYRKSIAQSLSSQSLATPSRQSDPSDWNFARPTKLEKTLVPLDDDSEEKEDSKNKGFFGRFVEGYTGASKELLDAQRNERLTTAISEWFGQQNGIGDEDEFI